MTADQLMTPEGRAWLIEEYVNKKQSTYTVAQLAGTYANRIRRALQKHGLYVRNMREAVVASCKNGVIVHPTRGRYRDEGVRDKISIAVHRRWMKLTKADRKKRVAAAQQAWNSLQETERDRIISQAFDGMRRAALKGSKLEHYLFRKLQLRGFQVVHRPERPKVDIYISDMKVGIEVRGPTTFLPIWGEEQLEKNILAHERKIKQLLSEGLFVIQVSCMLRDMPRFKMRRVLHLLLDIIETKKFPTFVHKFVELEVKEEDG